MATGTPKAWDDLPKIGGVKAPGPQAQDGAVEVPAEFVEGLVYRLVIPACGEFHYQVGTPMSCEPGLIVVMQCFAPAKDDPNTIIQYRHLQFANPVNATIYLCKPPKWWAEKVLAKKTVIAE